MIYEAIVMFFFGGVSLRGEYETAELAIDNDYLLYDGKSFKLQNKEELGKLFEIIGVEIDEEQ